MASHVAEHVPDLVTWLDEARSVLNPGGQLRLVLPDMRFSHDALRQPTRLTDIIAAWVLKARRPQVRDVLDFRLFTASGVDGVSVYEGVSDLATVAPDHSFDLAVQAATDARNYPDFYFDVHCWTVSAGSFAGLMEQIAEHGLLRMKCLKMIDTAPPIFEFYVFLTPCDDPAEVARSWREVQSGLRHPLAGSGAERRLAAEAAAARRDAQEHAALQADLARAQARLAETERSLAILKGSASWRITAPLRRLRAGWERPRRT